MNILLSTAYLPPVEYLQAILKSETIYIEGYESFSKQSYRNRAHILTAQGILDLSIPLCKYANHEITKNIRISYDSPWPRQHFNALTAAYNSSPFFEFYVDFFKPFYTKKYHYLVDYNIEYLQTIFKLLHIEKEIILTDFYDKEPNDQLDLRFAFHPKKGILLPEDWNKPYYYPQIFTTEQDFTPHLSIIDLLSNMGPQSYQVLI